MSVPSVVLHFDFLNAQSNKWKLKGDTKCSYDYYDYNSRGTACPTSTDYYNYTGDNKEKTEGNFDIENDKLSTQQVSNYRELERKSRDNGCIKYLGFYSFDNNFLKENNLFVNKKLDTQKMKKIIRSSMSELIHQSHKIDDDNVCWTGAIHVNTDNIHVHITMFEKEKRERHYKNDCIELSAIEKAKSKVVHQIINTNKINNKLNELTREILVPQFKFELEKNIDFDKLISQLPQKQELWYYNRKEFSPYKKIVTDYVDKIIETTPELKKNYTQLNKSLDQHCEKLKEYYGSGKTNKYLEFKKNKLDDFYTRAGNTLLKELKNYTLCVLSEKKMQTNKAETIKIQPQKHFEQDYYTTDKNTEYENLSTEENIANKNMSKQYDGSFIKSVFKAQPSERKLQTNTIRYSKNNFTTPHDNTLRRIVNQFEHHIEKLQREFDSDEEFRLKLEQFRIECEIENER